MTREEAIEILSRPKSMKGVPAEILTAHAMAIKALEQEPKAEVLDKIRAEIMDFEEELFHRPNTDYSDYSAVRYCVEIIDKYKAESEGKKEGLKYCDRNICVSNEYSGIGCDECMVNAESEDKE